MVASDPGGTVAALPTPEALEAAAKGTGGGGGGGGGSKDKKTADLVYTDIGDYKAERAPRRKPRSKTSVEEAADQVDIDPASVEGKLKDLKEQLKAENQKKKRMKKAGGGGAGGGGGGGSGTAGDGFRTVYMPAPAETIPVGVSTQQDKEGGGSNSPQDDGDDGDDGDDDEVDRVESLANLQRRQQPAAAGGAASVGAYTPMANRADRSSAKHGATGGGSGVGIGGGGGAAAAADDEFDWGGSDARVE